MPSAAARRLPAIGIAALALGLLGGCARSDRPAALAAMPAAQTPPRPTLPPGYAAVTPPPRDAGGGYVTINSGLDGQATIWHVRAALNVAAIGCRGPEAAGIVPAYNAMLASHKAALARAQKSVQAQAQASAGKDWQAADDAQMTRLYNYFAMPAAKPGFCAAAAAIAPQAATAPAAGFAAFAADALPRLEAPFVAVYRTVDDHRVALAAWEARYGADAATQATATETASSAPARPGKAPRLAYRDIDSVIAWQPRTGEALASR